MDNSIPRISANQLGQFAFGTPSEKKRIIYSQKHPKKVVVGRYNMAHAAILRSFQNGIFSETILADELDRLKSRQPKTKYQAGVLRANITALRRFIIIREKADPPSGLYSIIRSNASFLLDGVQISVLPDIISENGDEKKFAYLKIRLSTHRYSQDASQMVLLLLQKFAEARARDGLTFDFDHSKLIDCFSMHVFEGRDSTPLREKLLHKAITDLKSQWPFVP